MPRPAASATSSTRAWSTARRTRCSPARSSSTTTAQKTNAYQKNDNLLLSDDAEIDTKPELEIYADDVKCSHGATSGDLDHALFYLRSRGLDPATARSVLTFAFAAEVIERFADPTVRHQAQGRAVARPAGRRRAGGAGVSALAGRVRATPGLRRRPRPRRLPDPAADR